jgi:hypothetical protein
MPNITAQLVTTYAEIVHAAKNSSRITVELPGRLRIEGTMRHIVKGEENWAFPPAGADLAHTWVRITTRQGMDVAVRFTELAEALDGHLLAWSC